jgi:4-aminobutyrate aminotransferase-like enzyme
VRGSVGRDARLSIRRLTLASIATHDGPSSQGRYEGNRVHVAPPLNLSDADAAIGLAILDETTRS